MGGSTSHTIYTAFFTQLSATHDVEAEGIVNYTDLKFAVPI